MNQILPKKSILYSILALSSAILLFLVWLIYGRENTNDAPAWTSKLPMWNAIFNTCSAYCLIKGWFSIKKQKKQQHIRWMITALCFSALFLLSYIIYHHFQGDTKFLGQGLIRPIYFFILISHIVLSGVVLPLILTTLYFASSQKFTQHKKIARITFPIWLYVSLTGVAIFFMLKLFQPS